MFGLMRPNSCCSTKKTDSSYQYHRMHYCGTCKAIGQQFDQRSRMVLNYDTVFLSELLSQLNHEQLDNWDDNLRRVNSCFSMPQGDELPFSLSYSAAASVLLAELKVDDNIKDSNKLSWKLARRFYSKAFKKAAVQFEKLGIDTNPIYGWIDEQVQREANSSEFESLEDCPNYYAEATAQITAQIFEEGGNRLNEQTNLHQLGYQFGQLMYILDAFEDFERDVFKKQFNPLATYWGKERSLNNQQLEIMRSLILELQNKVSLSIGELPITEEAQVLYQERLASNLALRLYKDREVPTTFKERIVLRWNFAKEFASQVTCQPQSVLRQMNYYMIVLAVFVSPQTTEYLPQDGKMEVFKWGAFITATMASIGIAGVIRRKSRKERRKEKRKENRIKRFFKKLGNALSRRNSCCSSCCSSCCEHCGSACCDTICEGDNPWFWFLVILAIMLTTALVVLILFMVGVI